jgi:hypothetical protein
LESGRDQITPAPNLIARDGGRGAVIARWTASIAACAPTIRRVWCVRASMAASMAQPLGAGRASTLRTCAVQLGIVVMDEGPRREAVEDERVDLERSMCDRWRILPARP